MTEPTDWNTEDMPDETERFYSGRELTSEEYSKLSLGLKPSGMDDKWFIYVKEGYIYFHRSWTGHCIFIARIENNMDRIFLSDVTTNKKPEQFAAQDLGVKKEMFEKLVDLVLRK